MHRGSGDPDCPAAAHCTGSVNISVVTPQLTLTKTASPTSFTLNVPASYVLTVTNNGGAATTAVTTISDSVPSSLTLGTLPAGCTASGQDVTCTIATGGLAANGGSASFTLPVTPIASGSISNTASVQGGGDVTCPSQTRCNSTVITAVNTPQLTLSKTATSLTLNVPGTYTLRATNEGTAATTAAATVNDLIPADLTLGTLPAGCTAIGQSVTCTIAAGLAAGGGNVSFVIPVTPTNSGALNNIASIQGGGDPSCPVATRCNANIAVDINAPQLVLSKTASAATFSAGLAASYTLTVTNMGQLATTAIATAIDTLPPSLIVGTLPAGCTAAGQTVSCTIAAGLAANGGAASFIIPVTPTVGSVSLTNSAGVIGGGDPGCLTVTECADSITVNVLAPHLTVTKTASAVAFFAGTAASYTIAVDNTGDAANTLAAVITDILDTRLTPGVIPAGCTLSGQTVTCTIAAGALAATNGHIEFVIPVTPTASVVGLINKADLVGGGDSRCILIEPCSGDIMLDVLAPQMTLVKTASNSNFTGGLPESYTLTLTNTGTMTTAVAATVSDTFDASLILGALPAGCSATGQQVSCTVPAGLLVGSNVSFTIPVTPTTPISGLVNTASVVGGGDPVCVVATPCESSVTVNVLSSQLSFTNTPSNTTLVRGAPASYTLTITNTGTLATSVATITDTFDASLSIGTLPAGCTAAGQTITCTVAAGLAVGGSASFVIPFTPTALGTINNVANLVGGAPVCMIGSPCVANAAAVIVSASLSAAPIPVNGRAMLLFTLLLLGVMALTAIRQQRQN